MKKLLVLSCILLFCAACSTEDDTTFNENEALGEVTLENYKGIFTTLDGENRGTLEVTLAKDNLTASGNLTLSTGEVMSIFTDQITGSGDIKEIIFTSNNLSFTLTTIQEGETLEINTVTFRGLESSILAGRNTERTPLSTVTGTYVCDACPTPLDNTSTQTFNLMFTNAGGDDSSIASQTTLGGSSYAGVATQSGCAVDGDETTCNLNSGTMLGVTSMGFNSGSGPVTWTGTHFFDNTTGNNCSTITGDWQWASTSIGTVGGTFTSDPMTNCPVTLVFEDFEDAAIGYTLLDVDTGSTVTEDISEILNEDYFGRADVGDFSGTDFLGFSNDQGTFFAAGDIDAVMSIGNVDNASVNWNNINITGLTTINVAASFAEGNDAGGVLEDWDDDSSVRMEYSFDNSTWTPFFAIEAETGAISDTAPRVDTDFDGIGDGAEITAAFTQHSQSFMTGGNTIVSIRIIMENLDAADEDIAFDNVLITGN